MTADAIRQDPYAPNAVLSGARMGKPSADDSSEVETHSRIPQKILPCALLSIIVLLALSAFFLFLIFKFEINVDLDVESSSHGLPLALRAGILLLPSTLSSTIAICILPAMIHLYLQIQLRLPQLRAANDSTETLPHAQVHGSPQSNANSIRPRSTASTRRRDVLRFVIHMGFMLVLCIAIVSSDIWLHASTISRQADVLSGPLNSADRWGRDLVDDCTKKPVNQEASTSSEEESGCMNTVLNEVEVTRTTQNASSVNQIIYLQQGKDLLATLADSRASLYSYTANSFSISTKCTASGAKCSILPDEMQYECTEADKEGMFMRPVELIPHKSMHSNSFDFIAPIILEANLKNIRSFKDNADIVYSERGASFLAVFSCQTSVFRVQFAHAKDRYRLKTVDPAPQSESLAMLSLMLPNISSEGTVKALTNESVTAFTLEILTSAIPAAALSSSNEKELSEEVGRAFSRIAISAAAGGLLEAVPADESAAPKQVTIVPKAAAYTLVTANVLYAVVSMLLSIAALLFSSMEAARRDRMREERAEDLRAQEAAVASGMTRAIDRIGGKTQSEGKLIS